MIVENGSDIWGRPQSEKRRTCMLMVTHSCNLNCTYCYESHKSGKTMTPELAKKLILKECETVRNNKEFDGLQIDFMGGEPMMNFALIKEIVEWGESLPLTVPHIYFMSSNGTLFDEDAKKWFAKYRDKFYVGVSYDGTPEMQQTNRGQASQRIDFDYFMKTWPDQGFHMTISQETLPYLAQGIISMQEKGGILAAALANGIAWTTANAEEYSKQLLLLEDYYLNHPEQVPINLLTRFLNLCLTQDALEEKIQKYCGSGTFMVTYDVDGKAYGCHMFTPIVMGENAVENKNIDWNCPENIEDPDCKDCILKRYCPSCVGFNLRYRHHLARRDHNWCNMVLVQTIRSCEFQIKILNTRREKLCERDAECAQAALAAYPVLKEFDIHAKAPFRLAPISE